MDFFLPFHIAVFAHIFLIFHPSPNFLEVAIQGLMGKRKKKKTLLVLSQWKLKLKNKDELALCVQ